MGNSDGKLFWLFMCFYIAEFDVFGVALVCLDGSGNFKYFWFS